MIHRMWVAVLRTLIVGISIITVAIGPACSKGGEARIDPASADAAPATASEDSSTPIDPRSIGAERERIAPCTVTHHEPCAGQVAPTKPVSMKPVPRPAPSGVSLRTWIMVGLGIFFAVGIVVGIQRFSSGFKEGYRGDPPAEEAPTQVAMSDDTEFAVWLANKFVNVTGATEKNIADFREMFERERRGG